MKAVLDSNVLISAFLFFHRDSAPSQLIRHLAAGRFCLCTCTAILDEVEGVLLRERTQKRYGYPGELVAQFRLTLAAQALLVEPVPVRGIVRDPNDDVVLGCALAAQADCIVSGDEDIRCLNAFEGIPIYAPRTFLERLEATG